MKKTTYLQISKIMSVLAVMGLAVSLIPGSQAKDDTTKKPVFRSEDSNGNGPRHRKLRKKFDENGDGQLDSQEEAKFKAFLEEHKDEFRDKKEHHEKMRKLKEKFDENGDGKIDKEEKAKLREYMESHPDEFPKAAERMKKRRELKEKFDANGDGKLDDEEKAKLREFMKEHRQKKGEKQKD